ncbi:MAG TPA: hypothetical protein VLG67_04990, partial [Candidatus Saccharimonadales bacterium]|nr:hypothetical protein [Candidatus Saccharimonadales bacterium]
VDLAKHLTDKDIERVVEILDGWRDKLTWEALCDACAPVIGKKPVRQTLLKFSRITMAYDACKTRLKEDAPIRTLPSMRVAVERINRLEQENERLKCENARLLQQFIVWQYNAYAHGLGNHQLNKALPSIDRGQTEK